MLGPEQYAWLCSPQGQAAWRFKLEAAASSNLTEPRFVARLDRDQQTLLLEQWSLAQGKARTKVELPQCWFWTRTLLEQASDEWTARETALDAPLALPRWIDVCCGAGVDCVSLARRRSHAVGIDCNPIALLLARANSMMNQVEIDLLDGQAESIGCDRETFLHIDPDRRADGQRTIDPLRSQPAWPWISDATCRSGAVSLKLAPALRVDDRFDWGSASPPHARRWLSWEGSVRQQRWYWNIDRWPDDSRIASCGRRNHGWHHEVFDSSSMHVGYTMYAIQDASILKSGWIADQDPVVRAASIGGCLAERLGVSCIGDRNGYYYSPQPVLHPMLQWFRIIDIQPMDSKKIRAMASRMCARTWELKSRGVELDLIAMQRQLRVDSQSDQSFTILLTRLGRKHVAIFAQRTQKETA